MLDSDSDTDEVTDSDSEETKPAKYRRTKNEDRKPSDGKAKKPSKRYPAPKVTIKKESDKGKKRKAGK